MAFLGIRVPAEAGRLITGLEVPGIKESPSEYHITILCFDDNWPISEISKALEATYDVVSKIEPFLVSADKVDHFPKREDNPIPIIAPIKSDELQKLRAKVAAKFEKEKIDFKKTFKDYKPHITLSYSEDKHDDYKIDPPIEFMVNEVVLWGGDYGDDRIFITFPLKGPERQKHSLLVQQAETFYKMASNPPQEHFTPSFERRVQTREPMRKDRALQVLELPIGFTGAHLTSAMRKLVKRHHPDQGGDPEKLQEVIDAYRLLRDHRASVPPPRSLTMPTPETEKVEYNEPAPWGDWYNK